MSMPLTRTHLAIARVARWGWPQRFPLVQFPNPPLALALAAGAAARATAGTGHRLFTAASYVALSVWSYEEAHRGANWFRRLLGAGVAIYTIVSLANAINSARPRI
ncbi:MAG: hypothetical protein ACYDHN_12400 [Solirubrobacteraceae bacterium]